jgi:hypothetical protein
MKCFSPPVVLGKSKSRNTLGFTVFVRFALIYLFIATHLIRLSSFSEVCIAATSAAALSAGAALTSQILLSFNGPFVQSGPIAAFAKEAPSTTKAESEYILTTMHFYD